jgi:hypothetical protein
MKYRVNQISHTKQGIEEMAERIKPYPWKWLLHLTFAYIDLSKRKRNRKRKQKQSALFHGDSRQADDTIKPERAKKLFKNFMRTVGRGVIYFMVVEWKPHEADVHIHALIGQTTKPIRWKHGVRKLERYDPTRGVRFYILKFFFTDHFDMAFRLPRKIGGSRKIVV